MVIEACVLAGAVVMPSRLIHACTLLLALAKPAWGVPLLMAGGAMAWRARERGEASESEYLHAVAMEMQAGASLRSALAAGADRTPDLDLGRVTRMAAAGAPLARLADGLVAGLPRQGRVAAAAVRTAGRTGGQVAAVFESLAQVSAEDRDMRREIRAASAQARISAWIVGGLPTGYLAFQLASGRLADLLESPVGVGIVTVGVSLLGCGALIVVGMVKAAVA